MSFFQSESLIPSPIHSHFRRKHKTYKIFLKEISERNITEICNQIRQIVFIICEKLLQKGESCK